RGVLRPAGRTPRQLPRCGGCADCPAWTSDGPEALRNWVRPCRRRVKPRPHRSGPCPAAGNAGAATGDQPAARAWHGPAEARGASDRHVRVILVRDDKPRTRDRDDRGYGLPLVTTDLESSAEDLVARYAARWGIEQAFADARQIIGVGEARNRTRRAVERTVPFGLICFSVVTLWYALHGHCVDDVAG